MSVNINTVSKKVRSYISQELASISYDSPLMAFMKPLIEKVIDNQYDKVHNFFKLIADKDGNIDVKELAESMASSLVAVEKPFTYPTILGDITIGNSQIRVPVPYFNKTLVFTKEDIIKLSNYIYENSRTVSGTKGSATQGSSLNS